MPPTNPLVDQTVITQAKTHYDTQAAKLATAITAVETAAQAYDAAQAALATAAHGEGSVSTEDAARAVEDADRARRVAALVRQAADKAAETAKAAQFVAEGKAWRGVYLDGVRRRVAAARAGDEARAALEAADQAHAEATRLMEEAINHGTVGVQAAHDMTRRLMTEADEMKLWTSHRFDPVAGTYPGQWDN